LKKVKIERIINEKGKKVRMDKKTREKLGISLHNYIKLKKAISYTVATVHHAKREDVGKEGICISETLSEELGVSEGDCIYIEPFEEFTYPVGPPLSEKGVVRIDKFTRQNLGVSDGEVIYVEGRKRTKARVKKAKKEDIGKGYVRISADIMEKAEIALYVSLGKGSKMKKMANLENPKDFISAIEEAKKRAYSWFECYAKGEK